jgi:hypothetical protein
MDYIIKLRLRSPSACHTMRIFPNNKIVATTTVIYCKRNVQFFTPKIARESVEYPCNTLLKIVLQCPFFCKRHSMTIIRTKILPQFSSFDRLSLVSPSKRYLHKWPQNAPFLPAPPAKQVKPRNLSTQWYLFSPVYHANLHLSSSFSVPLWLNRICFPPFSLRLCG